MNTITTPAELKAVLDQSDESLVLLDVRSEEEFAAGSIAGALNMSVSSLNIMSKISKLNPAKKYIVFCRSGGRSQMAAMLMNTKSLDVTNCVFGYMSWPQHYNV
jgi:rhodanese-related sulfurtransferase